MVLMVAYGRPAAFPDQSETCIETRLTHSNGPIRNLDHSTWQTVIGQFPPERLWLVNSWKVDRKLSPCVTLAWRPSVTSASFPSRFLIGKFEWVSLVSMQVSDWSIWMSHVVFWTTVIAPYQSLLSDWSIWKILLCDWLFVVGSEVY